ncbi:hypothetical protein [Dyella sp.]|uniref:hypothetical protein n=1 Tax=Dyella sp. TaxID=1869338 RepID=UPI003F820569
MSRIDKKSRNELEDAAAITIGRITLVLSRLEFNLGLYLRAAVGGRDPVSANALVERLTLKRKMDALQEVVAHKFLAQPEASNELEQWIRSVDSLRSKRNSFVHGRWGFNTFSQELVNVAPGLPSSRPQKEVRFSVDELESTLAEAQGLATTFSAWSKRWPV